MVVHLGVVVMAIAIVTSTSYATRREVTLATGQSTVVAGQYITFHGFSTQTDSLASVLALRVDVNHHALHPAVTTYHGRSGQPVGTPAILSGLSRDVYVTFDAMGGNGATSGAQLQANLPAGSVLLGVTVEPLLSWLWIGGLLLGGGSALSFLRRRHREEVPL
jgi:cytochrome c-type biogenesis protein CcmF